MSKIHRPPRGLQHLLGSQSFGQNPDQLSQFVQPTVDLTGMYGAELLKTASDITVLATEGLAGEVTFTAPVAIVGAMLESGTAMAVNEYWAANIRVDGLGGTNESVALYSEPIQYLYATHYATIGFMLPYPLYVPGGAQVKAYVNAYDGAALTYTLRVLYYDLNPIDDT